MHSSAFIQEGVHAFPAKLMAGVFNIMLTAKFINAFVHFACLRCNKLKKRTLET